MKSFIKILFLLFLGSITVFAQIKTEIEQNKAKLYELRNEISKLEEQLAKKSKNEKESLKTLHNYSQQSFLLNKILNKLRKEVSAKQRKINKLSKKIKKTEDEINQLKDNYSKYVVALYKKGPYNEMESIIDAKSFRQAVVRIEYLKKFSERRKKDLEELKSKKEEYASQKKKYEAEKKQKQLLVAEKISDENRLKKKLNERKRILSAIKNDKAILQENINTKIKSQQKIKNLVAQLVEEAERKRKEQELKKKQLLASKDGNIVNEGMDEYTGSEYSLNTSEFKSFNDLRGRMIWPVHKGKIVRGFGKNRNKELNTVTLNYGIDISASGDLNVRCVADGIVSAIDWIPGYGSVIIVTHKGEYRTVYSHLAEIFVDEGDKVKTGKLIGKVGESLEGKVLHFEIWNSRENQNPEKWLAKK